MTALLGKTALITGAKGGLGTYVTQAFLDAGASVYGTSRSIRSEDFPHPQFNAVAAELNSPESAQKLVSSLPGLDIVVHLLGAYAGGKSIENTETADLDRMLDLNLRSAFFLAQAALPPMRAKKGGRFLAVGSRSAVEPAALSGAYNLSKAALVSLVKTIAAEGAGQGVSANVVLPGTMNTSANRAAMPGADHSKWVQPQQVAALLVHLASDAGMNINGAAIPIYGGAA